MVKHDVQCTYCNYIPTSVIVDWFFSTGPTGRTYKVCINCRTIWRTHFELDHKEW